MGGLGGDIGARDATVGEIESGFTETCLGHADTDHMNRAPKAMADMIKLAVRQIGDDGYDAKLTFEQQEVFRKQVWDWKIRPGKGNFECLRREFSVKDGDAEALVEKINAKCEAEGWTPAHLGATSGSNVVCELGSDAVKGITTNDFILAAKIDETEDILSMVVKAAPKARNWF
ncbi:hypothetical protein BE221DRAFT_146653 [Ostreococcus tauri]|uniref:4a-hydroxytetrahydrobiopterin dehydratase n=1 Tax=Ostreococcus tauri TaxID=70448 RepID=A0A1Y5IBB9_OSTTA|nr:hypothetical protein BE221DRAFT_146653 [Ostreococcus tauri]